MRSRFAFAAEFAVEREAAAAALLDAEYLEAFGHPLADLWLDQVAIAEKSNEIPARRDPGRGCQHKPGSTSGAAAVVKQLAARRLAFKVLVRSLTLTARTPAQNPMNQPCGQQG